MSTRAINFLDKWMAEQLPETSTDDPVLISDLADQVLNAADRELIGGDEITEEVGSVFEVISAAVQHRHGGSPE